MSNVVINQGTFTFKLTETILAILSRKDQTQIGTYKIIEKPEAAASRLGLGNFPQNHHKLAWLKLEHLR